MDTNAHGHLKYLHVFGRKELFLQQNNEGIFVKMVTKNDEGLDFRILVFKRYFNQITK